MSQARAGGTKREVIVTPSRRLVLVAFAVVGLVVAVFTSLSFMQTRALEMRARELVDDMLTSVRLLGQLENQVQRQQTLIDEHILATEPAEMAALEARLAALATEIEETSRAYRSWVTLPSERSGWDKTRADLMAIRQPVARALTLSRENRDLEARQEMQLVAEQFATVGRDFDQLISINDRAAVKSMERYSMIQLRLVLTLIAFGALVLAGTVVVGRWAARQVGRREEATALEARSLEERNRELDAFAGRVAHDIRNPLMAISMAARQLEGKVPEGTRATETLRRGVHRMEMLVEDLLALARLEKLTRAVCDPAAVAAQVREEFAARVEGESGNLRVAVAPAAVSCSEGLLRQVLTNLTENAVKYRRPGVIPEVEIRGVPVEGGYDLRVSDNGLGMTPDEAGHVFEPFYRSPRTRDLPGTGLGLSIVSRVARASGGTLSLETHVGEGSTFTLHLPLADASPGPQT